MFDNISNILKAIGNICWACRYIFNSYLGRRANAKLALLPAVLAGRDPGHQAGGLEPQHGWKDGSTAVLSPKPLNVEMEQLLLSAVHCLYVG